MSRLAALATHRPWRIILIAIAFMAVAVVVGGPLTANLTSAGFEDPDTEWVQARESLERASGANPGPGLIALVEPGADVTTGAGRAEVERVAAVVADDPAVAQVVTAFNGGGEALISNDGDASYVAAFFTPDQRRRGRGRGRPASRDALADEPDVRLGGAVVVGEEVGTIIGEDLAKAEMLAFPLIFLLSLWVFRGVVAALLPLADGRARDLRVVPGHRALQRGR